MENKHTPGPWFQSHREIPNDIDGMYATQVYTEDGKTIATLAWYEMPQRKEVVDGKPVLVTGTYREANAKLIAAAPELLEALQSSLNALEWYKKEAGYRLGNDAITKAKAAIKKATE
jgi:hypothetical protein